MDKYANALPPAVTKARLATLDTLRAPGGLLSAYLDPIPSKRALARWFRQVGISRLKANPTAARGGGVPFFHVAQVEKLLRSRVGE